MQSWKFHIRILPVLAEGKSDDVFEESLSFKIDQLAGLSKELSGRGLGIISKTSDQSVLPESSAGSR